MTKPFVHLHLHTKYSMLDGACHLKPLCERAAELGMPAIAMTDHGVMNGALEFSKVAHENGIHPIIGCEFYINAHAPCTNRDPRTPYHHLVLLATNDEGYHNLSRLNTLAHLEGFYYKPRIDKELLNRHAAGLIGLSACMQGEVNSLLRESQIDQAARVAEEYAEILGRDNFYLEMQDHGIPEQKTVNEGIRELRRRLGLGYVVTNDVHYLMASHAEAHELMLAMQTGTVMSDPKRMRYHGNQFYFKSREELERLFPDDPEAFETTLAIADRCRFDFGKGVVHFPTYDLPSPHTDSREYLIHLGHEGLRSLYGVKDCRNPSTDFERELLQRFDYEIGIIEKTGFVDYFLVVADFVQHARSQGIPVGPGRGSGGGSVVAYALGITRIEPLRFHLIFERFLNPDRVSPPDFDIDFCQSRRGEVIDYVKQKYGTDRVAQIATFGQIGAKTAIRDIARVLEIPLANANRLAKLIPDDPKITLGKARESNPDFRQACETDPDLQRILPFAEVLEGLYRNAGMHAAGVVIGDRPLIDLIPLMRDKEGSPMTQYSKDDVEECGLLKMDFLGLKTLSVLQEAVELVKRLRGIDIDLDDIPLDDPPTYALLNRADTKGVFQLESEGMRKLLREVRVQNIEDVGAVIALFRPGPMDMLPTYKARKLGKEATTYDHPLLEPILKDTYGVMVYQEQVQRAANVLAGYSLGQADLLRRAMGKKKKEIMDEERARFVDGCATTNQIPGELAQRIFDNIAAFAGYGFNKAHSVGYSIITFQTAYLKANFPAEFMAAQISSEIGNFDKLPGFVTEASDMGLPVLPPDVNHSSARFVPENEGIRYGLAGIKSVGNGAAEAIVREREAGGTFSGLIDFCERVDAVAVNKRVLEALVRSGAMDSLDKNRARLFNAIDLALARAAEKQRERASGQQNLFEAMGMNTSPDGNEELPPCRPWTEKEKLAGERELLGVYISGNPLDRSRRLLKAFETMSISRVLSCRTDGIDCRVCGLATSIQKRISKKNQKPWAILTIEDGEQRIEVLVFNSCYTKFADKLQPDQPLLVCGEISLRDEQPKIMANEIYLLEDAPKAFATRVVILIERDKNTPEFLADLAQALRQFPGKLPVRLCVIDAHGRHVIIDTDRQFCVDPTPAFVTTVEKQAGRNRIGFESRDEIYMEHKKRRFGPRQRTYS